MLRIIATFFIVSQLHGLKGVVAVYDTDQTVLEIPGLGFVKGKPIQTVGYNGREPKIYHSYRNLKFATVKERFQESELVENSLGADAQHPYDGTKYGPLCQQGSMDPAQFSKLNGLIINDIIDKVLQKFLPLIPDSLKPLLPDIDTQFVLSILEAVFGQGFSGKSIEEILNDWLDGSIGVDEDCLHLQVAKPAYANETSNLPVMFFIYGGGYHGGTHVKHGPHRLGDYADIIFVSINYRVGPLGFLCLESDEAAGNMGLLDQVRALEWVQKYIGYFGGDPGAVTIFGQSAGGSSVHHLVLSPLVSAMNPPLFRRAISQSGTATATWGFEANQDYAINELADMLNCSHQTPDEVIGCFRHNVTALQLTKTCNDYVTKKRMGSELGWGASLPCAQSHGKNKFYTERDDPNRILESGNYQRIPIMFGANSYDGTLFYDEWFSQYVAPNNLTGDADFLKNDAVEKVLGGLGFGHAYAFADLVAAKYFRPGQLGHLNLMIPGAIDVAGTFTFKLPGMHVMEQSAKHGVEAYWYSLEQKSKKSFCYIATGAADLSGNFPFGDIGPGVCHIDDLWHLFDLELPLVLCDLKPLALGFASAFLSCVTEDITQKVDYAECMTRPDNAFISSAGECINGTLTDQDLVTSENMVKAWTSFAINGKPSIVSDDGDHVFNIDNWSRLNPVYIQFASDGVHEQSDYKKTFTLANDEANGIENK